MMDCTNSTAPKDEELLSYVLDDEPLDKNARAHLEHCSICQQRLARYAETNRLLLHNLYRTQCPTATQLNFYCAGNILPIDETMRIAEHLKECPLCSAEVVDIRQILRDFSPFPEIEDSEPTPISLLKNIPKTLRRIVASFVPNEPQLVTRGSAPQFQKGWPRQYRAEALHISLHLSHSSNGDMMLLGLFTSDNSDESVDAFEGVLAELYASPAPTKAAERADGQVKEPLMCAYVDDLGNLVFKAVPLGEYTMIVHLANTEIAIEGLNIEHS
jgi:hypothetical protein